MSKMNPYSLIISLLLLQSCMKQPVLYKEPACYHSNTNFIEDGSTSTVLFHFDEMNRLSFIDRPAGTDDSISYEPGKITVFHVPKEEEFYTVFYLNEQSLAKSCEAYILGNLNDKRYFTYTPDGYLAAIKDSSKSGIVDYTLFYTDGNLTKFETKYANIHAVNTIEYYPEELKFWTYLDGIYFVGNTEYFPWMGKLSKSLPKSLTFGLGGINREYSYELDEKGYIKKRTIFLPEFNETGESFMEHECK